jgi:ubiquinone/menaquinone biosynthesis C-methylase UbiE
MAKPYLGQLAELYNQQRVGGEKWRREGEIVEFLFSTKLCGISTVIDMPVGTGRFVELYKRHKVSVTGLDLSRDMLQQASRTSMEIGCPVKLVEGSIFSTGLDGNSHDAGVCIRFLNLITVKELSIALSEVYRVVKRHAVIGIRVHRCDRHFINRVLYVSRALLRHPQQSLPLVKTLRDQHVHHWTSVEQIIENIGFSLEYKELVEARADRSQYFILLLRKSP